LLGVIVTGMAGLISLSAAADQFDEKVKRHLDAFAKADDQAIVSALTGLVPVTTGEGDFDTTTKVAALNKICFERSLLPCLKALKQIEHNWWRQLSEIRDKSTAVDYRGAIAYEIGKTELRFFFVEQSITDPKDQFRYLLERIRWKISTKSAVTNSEGLYLEEIAPNIVPELLSVVRDRGQDQMMRRTMLSVLEKSNSPAAVDAVTALLEAEPVNNQGMFYSYLGFTWRVGGKRGFLYLRKVLNSTNDPTAKTQIISAMPKFVARGVVDAKDVKDAVAPFVGDENAAVAKEANMTIKIIGIPK
jgi:hypothetical protein